MAIQSSVIALGESIPPDTDHAVSVSLPTWKSCIGYEEGEPWVVNSMRSGYPRFFIHFSIVELSNRLLKSHGQVNEDCLLFPTIQIATRCQAFITRYGYPSISPVDVRVLELTAVRDYTSVQSTSDVVVVFFPSQYAPLAKEFWQHSGDGISSRRAEACIRQLGEGKLIESGLERTEISSPPPPPPSRSSRGPRRYQRGSVSKNDAPGADVSDIPHNGGGTRSDSQQFVEERYGRNLDISLVECAKLAVRRRIAGSLIEDLSPPSSQATSGRQLDGLSEDNVYLFPCGMSAIFNAHQLLLATCNDRKTVCFGFTYVDTLKILQKFGPGCIFYGRGESADLDTLEAALKEGQVILGLFCEFPSNPLLKVPDLKRIRCLADRYGFVVVVDETIGNFLNVHVLPYADIVVSSLTKIFSGDSNVMGGSLVLNPNSPSYDELRVLLKVCYEDNVWAEDALFLERNSRDFASRSDRINDNAIALCQLFRDASNKIKHVYYPKNSPTRHFYDDCRCSNGGYGGLLSITFFSQGSAIAFYDRVNTAKGPSLGTNFTLTSPYTILAHYNELEWAASYGVDANLLRISVGLEEKEVLLDIYRDALSII